MNNPKILQPNGEESIFPLLRWKIRNCQENHELIGKCLFTHPLERLIGSEWRSSDLYGFMVKLVFAPDMNDEELFNYIIAMTEEKEAEQDRLTTRTSIRRNR